MKNFFIALATTLFLQTASAQNITGADVMKAAKDFGLNLARSSTGIASNGKDCEIYYGVNEYYFGVTASQYVSEEGVSTVSMSVGDKEPNVEIRELKVAGHSSSQGIFKVRTREHVPAHETDFGMKVFAYDVDQSTELKFIGGKLIEASAKTSRPWNSFFIYDPDYRGGEVDHCRFR